jgi:hypothetical protein
LDYVDLISEQVELQRLRQHNAALNRILLALGSGEAIAVVLEVIAAAVREALHAEDVQFCLDGAGSTYGNSAPHPALVTGASPLCLPLLRDGQQCGTLIITRDSLAGDFSPPDMVFAQEVAAQAVIAIDRAERDAEALRRVARAEALREIAHELSAELDMVRCVEATREQVSRLIDYESC